MLESQSGDTGPTNRQRTDQLTISGTFLEQDDLGVAELPTAAEGPRWNRRDLAALILLGVVGIFFFWPLVTPDAAQRHYIVGGDFTSQFYPYHYFAAAEWWARRIPLWNPYMFGGHPFQADIQTAVFYPPSLVVNLLAGRQGLPFRALELQGVVDYVLAGTFTYLFLRTIVRDRPGAFLGAVVFAFGGYLTSYPFQQLAVLETSIWLPLVLLLLEAGVRRPRRGIGWWLLAGLAMAVAILGGHPQTALFVGYTAAAYLLFRGWRARLPVQRVILGLLVFGAAAAGGAAVQVLPTFELTGLSTRAGITYEIAASGYDYIALPGLLLTAWRGEQALYLGVATLLLAIVALWRRPRGEVWFWGIIALAALALSFGDRGLLYRLFHALAPGFATFKGQERAAFVFCFAGAVLAAYGLAALRSGAVRPTGRRLALTGAAVALAGLVGVAAFWPPSDTVAGTLDLARVGYPRLLALLVVTATLVWLAGRGGIHKDGQDTEGIASGSRPPAVEEKADRETWIPACAGMTGGWRRWRAGGIFGGMTRDWRRQQAGILLRGSAAKGALLATYALVVLAVGDVLAANWLNNMSRVDPAPSGAQREVVAFLKEQERREGEPLRVRPERDDALPSNYGAIAGLPFAAGDSPIVVQRTQDLFGSPEEWRLWQMLNVKYFVSFGQQGEALEEVFSAPPLVVYRNRFSLPRAWVVENVRLAQSTAESKEMMLGKDFDPGTTAILEAPLGLPVRPAAAGEAPLEQSIRFDYYSPRRVYLHAGTNRDGLLVLSEAYYPGWQAKLDGAPVPILRVNHMLRGIALPAGEHELEMVYDPGSFWIGLGVSFATLVAVAGVWVWLGLVAYGSNRRRHSIRSK